MTKSEIRKLQSIAEEPCDVRSSLKSFLAQQVKRTLVKPMKAARLAKKKLSREEMNAQTADIREQCVKRSGTWCECGCGQPYTPFYPAEMDHFLGGHGRRKQRQSVESCWMLRRDCHAAKTRLSPSSAFWDAKWAAHAARYGYPVLTHIQHNASRRSTP